MEDKTGGPAFPLEKALAADGSNYYPGEHLGMSLRDYFAANALKGILSECDTFWAGAAPLAYEYADAMLKVRKQ